MIRVASLAAAVLLAGGLASPLFAQQAAPADTGNRMHATGSAEELGHGRTMKVLPPPSQAAPGAAMEPGMHAAMPADGGNRMHGPAMSEAMGHGRTMKVAPKGHEMPSSAELSAAAEHMHHAMAMPLTGDPDIDFVRAMIPHHEGAVEMARVVVEHGKDPQIRKLAEAIIAAQQAEITLMQKWLQDQK